MTDTELINHIKGYYQAARNSDFPLSNISRGRKHSISSKTEDLIAYFISKRTIIDYNIMVDYPISYKSMTKLTPKTNQPSTITFYPDIALFDEKQNTISHIIDIKMDLGWKRDIKDTIDKAIDLVSELHNIKVGSYKRIDEYGQKIGDSVAIRLSPNLVWHIIVISDQNISQKQMDLNLAYAHKNEKASSGSFKFYIFTKGEHPNGGKPKIDSYEIKRFIDAL